ncbi:hypothetical protein TNCV_217561 [Trichonephila clavipes]|nr:hypothetical protein TNCV_217561 [Trichonephila clavipes]
MMDRIPICEAMAKRKEIDPFLKRMLTGDEKWIQYYNFVRKRSWLKGDEAAQTVTKPRRMTRKFIPILILTDGVRLPDNHRQTVYPNGTLFVRQVERTIDEGRYTCTIRNKEGESARGSLYITVRGNKIPEIPILHIKFQTLIRVVNLLQIYVIV